MFAGPNYNIPDRTGPGGTIPSVHDCSDHSLSISPGLSGIVPLSGALEVELGAFYFRHDHGAPGDQWGVMALGRVNRPLAENGLDGVLMAGPVLALDCRHRSGGTFSCKSRRDLDFGLVTGAGLEHGGNDGALGLTFGVMYKHGMLGSALRAVGFCGGLVYRIGRRQGRGA